VLFGLLYSQVTYCYCIAYSHSFCIRFVCDVEFDMCVY